MMTEEERKESRKRTLRKYRVSRKNYENQLRYRKRNMEAFAEAARRNYWKDPEAHRARQKELNATPDGRIRVANKSKRYAEKNREKRLAKDAVNNAVRSGKLVKRPCWCGSKRVEGHHPDYSKPLDVIWLCHTHHKEVHYMANNTVSDADRPK
jgi:hypothetical protein